MKMFKYLKLKAELATQKKINRNNEEIISCQKRMIQLLNDEISRRDQKISDLLQQKGSKNPDPLNFEFPGTEKQFDDFWTKFYCPK